MLCPQHTILGFRTTHKAIGMLLRDLESSFRRSLPWQWDLCVFNVLCVYMCLYIYHINWLDNNVQRRAVEFGRGGLCRPYRSGRPTRLWVVWMLWSPILDSLLIMYCTLQNFTCNNNVCRFWVIGAHLCV